MHHSFLSATEELFYSLLLVVKPSRPDAAPLPLETIQVGRYIERNGVNFKRRQSRELCQGDAIDRVFSNVADFVAIPPRL